MTILAKIRAVYLPPRDEKVDDFDAEPYDPMLVDRDEYDQPDIGDEP